MLNRTYVPPRPASRGPVEKGSWLPPLSENRKREGLSRPMSAPCIDPRPGSRPLSRHAQSTDSRPLSRRKSRPGTAVGLSGRSSVVDPSVRPGSVKDLRSKLDAMTAPSLMNLRLNNQNVRKRLQQEGFDTKPYKIPPLERLRMEIRLLFTGRDWDFLETIQVVEFRDALEQKCGVPSGTFRNNTFMKLLSEEVQRHRTTLAQEKANAEVQEFSAAADDTPQRPLTPTTSRAVSGFEVVERPTTPTSSKSVPQTPKLTKASSKIPKEKPEDCEALWASTFHRLKVDGELHIDELERALGLIGVQKAEQSWIDEIITDITRFSTLSIDEFSVFVQKYRERQREYFRKVFNENDTDGSGAVDKSELKGLLHSVGVMPLPAVLEQVMDEVDEDGSGTVGFEEFEKVMEIMRVREGFTKNEIADFDHAFKKFDRDLSGEVDTNELIGILGWLGYSQSEESVREVVNKIDFDGSGSVSKEEFLVCMRNFRQREADKVGAIMALSDTDNSGTINSSELRGLLKTLGYNLSPDVLREVSTDAGCSGKDEMNFEDVWMMINLFRMREGFLSSEVEDLRQGFDKYDKNGNGEIDCVDLGHVLRWMGFSPSLAEQQSLLAQVDIDKSGSLDFSEFMKLMRKKREAFFSKMHQTFCFWERDPEPTNPGTGRLHHAGGQLLKVLRSVGCFKMPENFAEGGPNYSHEVDFEDFIKMVKRSHDIDVETFRQNAGFSDQVVAEYKKKFEMYDADRSGDISNRELQRLLMDLYPLDSSSKDARPKLAKLMQSVDADGDGRLDFGDFLRLNRQYQTELENERIMKEQTAIEETEFPPDEVEGYRALFQQEAERGQDNCVSLVVIQRMINSIVPLGAKHKAELKDIMSTLEGSGSTADFPEFLRIMKQVQDLNLGGINEKAAEITASGSGKAGGNSRSSSKSSF